MPCPYDAVLFDLLTALLDSWTLWNSVAGDAETGRRWRSAYLRITYATGAYRPYETLVAEAAAAANCPAEFAPQLLERWDQLQPWPGVLRTLDKIRALPMGIVTNCSESLAQRAARRAGLFPVVVSAERAGFYKPDPRPYQLALRELGTDPERTLFVAGSPFDLTGAAAVGMPVFWHNHVGLKAPENFPVPARESRDFRDLLSLLES